MAEFTLGFENLREKYPEDKYILVLPSTSMHIIASRPMFRLDVTTVKIDPNDKSLVYKPRGDGEDSSSDGDLALSKIACNLLAAAADVDVEPTRTDNGMNIMYANFLAKASMPMPSGKPRERSASVEWLGEVERERIKRRCINYYFNARDVKRWKNLVNKTDEELMDMARDRFTGQWLDEQTTGKRKAESKACRNAITNLLAMRGTYSFRELAEKQFAVAKLVFSPDTSDPAIVQMLVAQGMDSGRRLYSGAPAMGGGQQMLGSGQPVAGEIPASAMNQTEPAHEAPTWDQVADLLGEIPQILSGERLDPAKAAKLLGDYTAAVRARDAVAIERVHNLALDLQLASEGGEI